MVPRGDDGLQLFDFVGLEDQASQAHARRHFIDEHPLGQVHRVGDGQHRQLRLGSVRPFEDAAVPDKSQWIRYILNVAFHQFLDAPAFYSKNLIKRRFRISKTDLSSSPFQVFVISWNICSLLI